MLRLLIDRVRRVISWVRFQLWVTIKDPYHERSKADNVMLAVEWMTGNLPDVYPKVKSDEFPHGDLNDPPR